MYNLVVLIGQVFRDPKIYVKKGNPPLKLANYKLKVFRRKPPGSPPDTRLVCDFPRIVTYGRNAEITEMYIRDGTRVFITGRVQTSEYMTYGRRRVYVTDIVADRQLILSQKYGVENAADAEAGEDAGMEADADVDLNFDLGSGEMDEEPIEEGGLVD